MDIRAALKDQYHASLAMLGQCVELCPADLWVANDDAVFDGDREIRRAFWRIAFHAAFFTQYYLGQDGSSFRPWPDRRDDLARLWEAPDEVEPYEMHPSIPPCSPAEILGYIAFVDSLVDSTVDGLDLDRQASGFSVDSRMPKLNHQILNIRHVMSHVGQLSELLMARGIDIDWK